MKKGTAKTNILDISKTILNIKISDEFRVDNILTLKEIYNQRHRLSESDKNYIAYAKF